MYKHVWILLTLVMLLSNDIADAEQQDFDIAFKDVECQGSYRDHLQGICTDSKDSIFWSFTTTLVKTDINGMVVKHIGVEDHHGDLCHREGEIFVAVNLGRFNDVEGNADSWVYVYNADDLSLVSKHDVQEVYHGAGGIGHRNGRFYIVGGLPEGFQENYVYEYDPEFTFVKKHVIKSGHTKLGIQTATPADNRWYFGCYGDPRVLLVTDASFNLEGKYEFDCSLGIVHLSTGRFLSATGQCKSDVGCSGRARLATGDANVGLRYTGFPKTND